MSSALVYNGLLSVVKNFDSEFVIRNVENKLNSKYVIEEEGSEQTKKWAITFSKNIVNPIVDEMKVIEKMKEVLKEELSKPFSLILYPYGLLELKRDVDDNHISKLRLIMENMIKILDGLRNDIYDIVKQVQNSPPLFSMKEFSPSNISVGVNSSLDRIYGSLESSLDTVLNDAVLAIKHGLIKATDEIKNASRLVSIEVNRIGQNGLEETLERSHAMLEKCEFVKQKTSQLSHILDDENGILLSVRSQCNLIQYKLDYISNKIENVLKKYGEHATLTGIYWTGLGIGVSSLITGIVSLGTPTNVLLPIIIGVGFTIPSSILVLKNNPKRKILEKIEKIQTTELKSLSSEIGEV